MLGGSAPASSSSGSSACLCIDNHTGGELVGWECIQSHCKTLASQRHRSSVGRAVWDGGRDDSGLAVPASGQLNHSRVDRCVVSEQTPERANQTALTGRHARTPTGCRITCRCKEKSVVSARSGQHGVTRALPPRCHCQTLLWALMVVQGYCVSEKVDVPTPGD